MEVEGGKDLNGDGSPVRKTSCEYEALETCLRRNGRDSSKCERELEEFKRSCKCPPRTSEVRELD